MQNPLQENNFWYHPILKYYHTCEENAYAAKPYISKVWKMIIVDSHCHLDMLNDYDSTDNIVNRAKESGLK